MWSLYLHLQDGSEVRWGQYRTQGSALRAAAVVLMAPLVVGYDLRKD